MNVHVPAGFQALVEAPTVAVLSTTRPDGAPHAVPVWYDYDATFFYVSTGEHTVKYRNLMHEPRAVLLFVDPANTDRYLAAHLRLDEVSDPDTGLAHLNGLAQRYMNVPVYPFLDPSHTQLRVRFTVVRMSSLG